jgi:ChaB protein
MPYEQITELPTRVKSHLPLHAQEIYLAAFDNAWKEYADPKKTPGRRKPRRDRPPRRLGRSKTVLQKKSPNRHVGGEDSRVKGRPPAVRHPRTANGQFRNQSG